MALFLNWQFLRVQHVMELVVAFMESKSKDEYDMTYNLSKKKYPRSLTNVGPSNQSLSLRGHLS